MAEPKRVASKANKRLSLSDVAQAAGVSKATVSLVLNGRSQALNISETTRQRVLNVARKVNYQPRVPVAYHAQVGNLLRQISLLFVNPTGVSEHDFFAPAFREIASTASEEGMLIHTTKGLLPCDVSAYCADLKARDSVGIVLFTFDYTPPEWLDEISRAKIPYVVFNRDFGPQHPGVIMDHRGQASDQVDLLFEVGHRQIACMGHFVSTSLLRREGYRDRMQRAGLYDPALEWGTMYDLETARRSGMAFLRQHPQITGVFCTTDLVALGMIRAARDLGLRVPEDLSVVSMDGYQFGEYTEPPLSTIKYPLEVMGRTAFKLLCKLAVGEATPPLMVLRGARIPGGCVASPRRA